MKFTEMALSDAWLIDIEPVKDERGFFARTWCQREFAEHGLVANLVQCGMSYNKTKGTLRGMHYQAEPHAEAKLIRCTQGVIYDVIVDLRPSSATYKKYAGTELSAENRRMLYVPPGVAHGFLTLTDGCEVLYQMSEFYQPAQARGVRWNDPAFAIHWPDDARVISERDRNYPDFFS